ncbi:MAG: MBL fold metallo-hydrolase [Planctomycetota bacterium]|nr:MBL fold metallo-hydrolase [Planctomycetota bacterium]
MTPLEYRVISIGTLPAHPLWDEGSPVRTGHATTTLITAGEAKIIVNPGLPPQALAARMSERSRVRHDQVTHVFITTFTQDHYRGLALFEGAQWLVHEPEQQVAGEALDNQLQHARENGDPEIARAVDGHLELLRRCQIADDKLAPGVDLFPLPGLSPGTCGLLLALPTSTVLLCGDAVPTIEHLQQGKVLPECIDIEQARESFREAIEIADVLIPGRDNLAYNPVRRVM